MSGKSSRRRTLRHVVNFGLLASFLTLAVTGGLAFVLPFSLDTTRVHLVFGGATMVLVGMHLASRVRYFRQQGTGRAPNGVSRVTLAGIVAGWLVLLAAALLNWAPVQAFVGLGYEAQRRHEIVRPSPLTVAMRSDGELIAGRPRTAEDTAVVMVRVSLRETDFPRPAVAIWAESTTGSMIETLYVSGDVAYSDDPEWHGKQTPREQILPVWRHRYTLLTGIDPSGEVDAVTGATANHQFSLDGYLDAPGDDYLIFVEINAAGDPDEQWPDPHVGQPSVLYSVFVEPRAERRYYVGERVGHGGEAANSGEISYDLENLTSAKQLVDLILVAIEPTAAAE